MREVCADVCAGYPYGQFGDLPSLQLCLVGIDQGGYIYLSEAEDITYNNANLAAPATPTSNISGGCQGYFSTQTISIKTGVVK